MKLKKIVVILLFDNIMQYGKSALNTSSTGFLFLKK